MVSREQLIIQANALQHRFLLRDDSRLFADLALCRFKERLAPLDPAAWQEPSCPIGVPHEKNAVFAIKYRGSRAQREATRLPV